MIGHFRALSAIFGLVVVTAFTAGCAPSDTGKNPFGVSLEPVPDDEDVKEFAKSVNLTGDPNDANAAEWPEAVSQANAGMIDGDWSGRWKYHGDNVPWVPQVELTKIATKGQRVYVLFKYHQGAYLIVANREGNNRLVGRFMGVSDPNDTGPFVGLIVSPDRIDGVWRGPSGAGRWDFRRKLN